MIVLLVYPDLSSARLTSEQAAAVLAARGPRHGCRVHDIGWDGTGEGQAERRQADVPVDVDRRKRAVRSVTDLPAATRQRIAADAIAMGPEATGRKYGLHKESVQRVMRLEGVQTAPNGRWKSATFTAKGRA